MLCSSKTRFTAWPIKALATALLGLISLNAVAQETVNLYSARSEPLIRPLLDQFSQQTGIKVNVVSGKSKALFKRLQAEGKHSPADVLITVDAGNLHAATELGLFQAVDSETLKQNIPRHLRDEQGRWYGLSQRSRVIVYNTERLEPTVIERYEQLAEPEWKGRLCLRSSNNIYNQSLLSSLIAYNGQAAAEEWAQGVVANMARPPKGNDRAQALAVASGQCDLAVINTYYLGQMQADNKDESQRQAAAKLGVIFPNQKDRGAHMNISGAGVTVHARNRDNAIKLLEFLSGDQAQKWYAEVNFEYPVSAAISPSETVKSWGYPFKQDNLAVEKLGTLNPESVKTFDRAGWR